MFDMWRCWRYGLVGVGGVNDDKPGCRPEKPGHVFFKHLILYEVKNNVKR
jgi:hypothetical protein